VLIQLRGTSGSGKSTAMRKIMSSLVGLEPHHVPRRKAPLFYITPKFYLPRTVVLGHYETPCGGCDTIGSARQVYELISTFPHDVDVLCEGLLLSEDTKWTSQLVADGWDVRVLFITTPVERCLEWIKARRLDAGNEKPLNPSNTVNRVKVIERARNKLSASGIIVRRCSADQSIKIVLNWLRSHDS
jgi:hypothetical protein